jgi:site-specific recombinase XerD
MRKSLEKVSTTLQQKKRRRKGAEKMYSVKITYNKDRIKANGNATIYIQIIIDREKWGLNLNVDWPHELIHEKGIKARGKNDTEHRDIQLVIDQRLAKINEIIIADRLGEQDLTISKLKDLFLNFDGRKDFIKFMTDKIEYRYKNNIVQFRTYKNNKTVLQRIIEFQPVVLYKELTEDYFSRLGAYLKAKGYKNNYIASIFKDVKKYIRLAKKDGVRFDDITSFVKAPKTSRSLVYLTEVEVERLYELFNHPDLDQITKNVLRCFLFSIETGLRISDIPLAKHDQIDENNVLTIIPYKTRGLEKKIQIPLTKTALKLINNNDFLFSTFSDQFTNRKLKEISAHAKINKRITFHVARHTFATLFLSRGGRVEVLQKLLGHTKIETTMVYVHVDISRIKSEMLLMEKDRGL